MKNLNRQKVISNITTSEANLSMYTQITKIIGYERLSRKNLFAQIKSKTPRKNDRIILNHLGVMEGFEMIKSKKRESIVLDGNGKALYRLIEEFSIENSEKLANYEKIFYFRNIFYYYFEQFYKFLENIRISTNIERDKLILDYFGDVRSLRIISKDALYKSYKMRENRTKISRYLENIYACMEGWCKRIGLLTNNGGIRVSRSFEKISSELEKVEGPERSLKKEFMFGENIYRYAYELLQYPQKEKVNFSYNDHKDLLIKYLLVAYANFMAGVGVSDLDAARVWICSKMLLNNRIILEETVFNNLLNKLVNEGIIRSVHGDSRGQSKYFTLETPMTYR